MPRNSLRNELLGLLLDGEQLNELRAVGRVGMEVVCGRWLSPNPLFWVIQKPYRGDKRGRAAVDCWWQ